MLSSFEAQAMEISKALREYRKGGEQLSKIMQQRLEIWAENLKMDAEKFVDFLRNVQEIGPRHAYEVLIYQLQKSPYQN